MYKFNKKQKVIIIVLISIIGVSFLSSLLQNRDFVKKYGYDPLMFLKYALIDNPIHTASSVIEDFSRLWGALDENDDLKQQIIDNENYELLYNETNRQLQELEELNELTSYYSSFDFTYANVVSRDIDMWNNFLVIDKGSNQGLEVDQIVISSKGLIGKIESVSANTAKVRLLTTQDGSNKVSVKIAIDKTTTVEAILIGYDVEKGKYILNVFNDNVRIAAGQNIITSGQGGLYPSGLNVGTIDSIENLNNQIGKTIYVTPSVNYSDFDYIAVIVGK